VSLLSSTQESSLVGASTCLRQEVSFLTGTMREHQTMRNYMKHCYRQDLIRGSYLLIVHFFTLRIASSTEGSFVTSKQVDRSFSPNMFVMNCIVLGVSALACDLSLSLLTPEQPCSVVHQHLSSCCMCRKSIFSSVFVFIVFFWRASCEAYTLSPRV